MALAPSPISLSEALMRFGGMYGSAWRDGRLLSEAVEVTGAVEQNRIEVPLPGREKTGYKPGRQTREGTLRIQKIDTSWELEFKERISKGLEQRRRDRDRGIPATPAFSLQIEFDDPDALGMEKWQLDGCLIWRMPLGFAITDDIVDREFPLTWEDETCLYGFRKVPGAGGVPVAQYDGTLGPPPVL